MASNVYIYIEKLQLNGEIENVQESLTLGLEFGNKNAQFRIQSCGTGRSMPSKSD